MNQTPVYAPTHDWLPQIKQIVRDAIVDGLLKSETTEVYDQKIKELQGPDLEDYLQRLWDEV